MTAADVAEYESELKNDESSVTIQAGETISERQMLEGLLLGSANDMAFSLAMWDAGSIPAFVAKMNALATSLGTTNTHYVDASGYDPASVSAAVRRPAGGDRGHGHPDVRRDRRPARRPRSRWSGRCTTS